MTSETLPSDTLPIVDLSLADRPETAPQLRAALRQATHQYGFFYLVGHGIDPALTRRVVSVAREFFALPEQDKLAMENTRSPHFRGYTRVGGERTEGKVDWREQIDIGPERDALPTGPGHPDYNVLQGPNLWPASLPELRAVVTAWNDTLAQVADRLLQEWAQSLGQERDVLADTFGQAPATLTKVVRYPGRSEGGTTQGVGWHNDFGVLTLLLVEPGKRGLQVEGPSGETIDAPPVEGALIVNIGEMLEWATNGYLRATRHRVLAPEAGTDRISVPYFHNPALEAVFPTLDLPPELAAEAPGVTVDESNPILGVYGDNALKSRVRAHPNVVHAHHPQLLARAETRPVSA